MSRLTKQTKFNYYYLKTTDGIHIDVLNDYGEVFIGTAVEKLAEYENLGSVEDFKRINHELDVYKRALELAEQTIRMICPPIAIGGIVPEHFNDTKDSEYFINQARKELEDERK